MSNNKRFILAVQLRDPDHFREVFGDAIVQLAHADLTRGITQLCEPLLRRYQCFSEVMSPEFGRWYRIFGAKDSGMAVDMREQIPVLQEIGESRVRDLLIACFGPATGCRQTFNLLIIPAPETPDSASVNRAIDRALVSVPCSSCPPAVPRESLQPIIENGGLLSYFQPIVSLPDEKLIGYEALTRGPVGSPLHEADPLFAAARYFDLTQDLELACLIQSMNWLAKIPAPLWISVNLGLDLFMSREFRDYLMQPRIKPLLPRVVFELTEHLPVESAARLHKAVAGFRDDGMRLSLDDTGCGFFDLTTVDELRPEIVKLCITVISRIGRSKTVEQEMRKTINAVSGMGGLTLGEGVEQAYQAEALTRCGAKLAQGNYFGMPQPAEALFPG